MIALFWGTPDVLLPEEFLDFLALALRHLVLFLPSLVVPFGYVFIQQPFYFLCVLICSSSCFLAANLALCPLVLSLPFLGGSLWLCFHPATLSFSLGAGLLLLLVVGRVLESTPVWMVLLPPDTLVSSC